MIFDSVYDTYRGVVTYVRMIDGAIRPRQRVRMMATRAIHELLEVGVISPEPKPTDGLGVGEVGYLITGVKDVRQSRVGDTVTDAAHPATGALGGYRDPKPMVYSGLYPIDGSDYPLLRDALDKLRLNDAALVYEPESSGALGFGFRVGFLGLLHLEIVRERLEREFGLDLISTAPNVVYRVVMEDGAEHVVTNPSDWPAGKIAEVYEPVVKAMIIAPSEYIGTIMELCQARRGALGGMDYLSESRVELRYTLPLAEIIFDFFDALKSRTRGYASLDYEAAGEQRAELVKVDILLQGEPVDAFSAIVHRDKAYAYGVSMVSKLRELIPRQQFEVPIQAAVGLAGDRPGEHPRHPQGRAGQVLRRRHHPQAQAAGAAEGRQEADEDGRPGRGAAGGVHRRAVHRGREARVARPLPPVGPLSRPPSRGCGRRDGAVDAGPELSVPPSSIGAEIDPRRTDDHRDVRRGGVREPVSRVRPHRRRAGAGRARCGRPRRPGCGCWRPRSRCGSAGRPSCARTCWSPATST